MRTVSALLDVLKSSPDLWSIPPELTPNVAVLQFILGHVKAQ